MTEPAPHPDSEPRPPIRLPVAHRPGASVPVQTAAAAPPAPSAHEAGFALSFGVQDTGARARGVPILGGLAAIFGVAALFKAPLVLAPLGFLFALGALFRGQAGLAAIGSVSGVVALAISPLFWGLVGLAWLGSWLFG